MKKLNSLIILLISLIISSCSTYNGFTSRKYYDFKLHGKEVTMSSLKTRVANLETIPSLKSSSLVLTSKTDYIKEIISPEMSVNQKKIHKKTVAPFITKSIGKIFSKKIKKSISPSPEEPKIKGKIWWLALILMVLSLFVALFASALLGTIFFILFFIDFVTDLILYIKSKHELAVYRKNGGQPVEKKKIPQPEPQKPKQPEPSEPKKPRG